MPARAGKATAEVTWVSKGETGQRSEGMGWEWAVRLWEGSSDDGMHQILFLHFEAFLPKPPPQSVPPPQEERIGLEDGPCA